MGEAVRVAVPGLYLACLPNWGPYYRASQDFIPHICTPPSAPPTQLWGVHEHVSSCGSKRSAGISPLYTSSCSCGFASLSSFLFPSSLGIDSDVECLGTSTRIYCLHCFSLHDFICSKYVEKKKKEKKKKHSAKPTYMFWTKKKIEVVFSVSDSELCCRLSVLLASVWPCFARMRYFPLWRILGEEEPHPQRFGGVSDSPKPLGNPGC